MERRSKIRFDINQPLSARLIGNGVTTQDQIINGTLENISGSGLRILSDAPLPAGAAIQIDLPDSMILAEVRYSEPAKPHPLRPDEKCYAIGLSMQEVLSDISQLARMVEGIMGRSKKTDPVRR